MNTTEVHEGRMDKEQNRYQNDGRKGIFFDFGLFEAKKDEKMEYTDTGIV